MEKCKLEAQKAYTRFFESLLAEINIRRVKTPIKEDTKTSRENKES